eukprot:1095790-Ditylum_brightwellii.AAC.1
MADDTETMLSLHSADQNDGDNLMEARDNNIGGTIQKLDYADENEKEDSSTICYQIIAASIPGYKRR